MWWPFKGLFRKTVTETVRDMSNREETRGKATLNWHLNADALRPKEAPFGFIGQNPVQVLIPPKEGRMVRTGISANIPLLVFPTRTHSDALPAKDGKLVEGASWPLVISPGEEICLGIRNTSEHTPLSVDDKEPVVCIHPLVFSGTTDVA